MRKVWLFRGLAIYFGLLFLGYIGIAVHDVAAGSWGWFVFDLAFIATLGYFALDAQSEAATLKQGLDDEYVS